MKVYFFALERTDGTMDPPFYSCTHKKAALRAARNLAKFAYFDCTRLWLQDEEENGIASFILPID